MVFMRLLTPAFQVVNISCFFLVLIVLFSSVSVLQSLGWDYHPPEERVQK